MAGLIPQVCFMRPVGDDWECVKRVQLVIMPLWRTVDSRPNVTSSVRSAARSADKAPAHGLHCCMLFTGSVTTPRVCRVWFGRCGCRCALRVVEMHFSAQPSQVVYPLQRAARASEETPPPGRSVSNAYLGCSCVLRGSLESLLCSNLAKYYQTCRQISISTLGGCRLCRATVLRAARTNLKLGAVVEWAWVYFSRCCTWPAFEAADEKERC
jgi:hypothetical protein